jgi:sugar fermentation stimulation protein A
MLFPSALTEGRLIRRYKRFLADVLFPDGSTQTVHVANSGAMTGLDMPGARVWVSRSANEKRTLPCSLEIVEADDGRGPTLVGINTGRPNGIVAEAIMGGAIPGLAGYPALRREAKYGVNSRVDILLSGDGRPDTYVEVKNVHLVRRPGLAEFPDSVTSRGAKHLQELSAMVAAGHRAVMVYLVHRGDCDRLSFASDIDPAYARGVAAACAAGVECFAVDCTVTTENVTVRSNLPIEI